MILNDLEITELANDGMINPFVGNQVREDGERKIISYGLSSFGYDLRLAAEMHVFADNINGYQNPLLSASDAIDPKTFRSNALRTLQSYRDGKTGRYFELPQFASALGHSVETLHLPDDVFALCVGKSTYARCGLIVNTTPLEPGWRGQLVIEIHNTTPLPIRIYANEGIAQLVFFKGDRPAVTYGDRAGKYQGQTGITTARI